MVRLVLIGVGVVSSAIAAYIAHRRLTRRRGELPTELAAYQHRLRARKRKARNTALDHALDNGEFGPTQ